MTGGPPRATRSGGWRRAAAVEAERLRGQARALGLIPPGLVMSLRIPQADGSPETPGGGEDR